ncbi:hypothetical protein [Kitasatospora sp. NPDC059800]|uniref:hypothetical protein n=1 Tax=Kitasatospora sp. NPDC059800 TaxID=3346951 RepID=UPI00364EB7A9
MSIARQKPDCAACKADQQTSMADARTAICLANDVAIDDIDPATGYNHSRHAYYRVRDSWVDLIRQHGYSELYQLADITEVRALWAEKRPEFVEGDDWLTEAFDAHREFVAALGKPCRRSSCDIHYPAP